MAIRIQEVPGRSASLTGQELKFLVFDDGGAWLSAEQVVAAVTANPPPGTPDGQYVPSDIGGFETTSLDLEEVGKGVFEVNVGYGPKFVVSSAQRVPEGEARYDFETSLESMEVNYSLQTMGRYASQEWLNANNEEDIPNFGRLINVDKDGVKGMSISVPTSRFAFRFASSGNVITEAYQRKIEGLVGSVNSVTWKGRDPGTVLFEGVTGGITVAEEDRWELTFNFRYRKNRNAANQNQVNIGAIPPFDVDGWDVLWVFTTDTEDLTSTHPIAKPTFAYVERVYPRADFAQLGLP